MTLFNDCIKVNKLKAPFGFRQYPPHHSVALNLTLPPERNTSTFSYSEVIFTKYIKKNIGLLALAYSTVQQLSVNISSMIILSKSKSQGKDSWNVTRSN